MGGGGSPPPPRSHRVEIQNSSRAMVNWSCLFQIMSFVLTYVVILTQMGALRGFDGDDAHSPVDDAHSPVDDAHSPGMEASPTPPLL